MAFAITDKFRFRRALKRQGGPLPPTHPSFVLARAIRRQLAGRIAPLLGLLRRKRFGFAFVDDDVPNAFVTKVSDTACLVTISTGLLSSLKVVLGQLVRNPEVARMLATETTVDVPSRVGGAGLSEQQDAVTGCLVTLAMEFILCHEVGHVLQAHLDVNRSGSPQPRLAERHMSQHGVAHDGMVSQLYEIQADRSAVTYSLHRWLEECSTGPLAAYGVTFINSHGLRDAWTLAVSTLFVLLGAWRGAAEDFFSSTHPFPAYRLQRIFAHRPAGLTALADQIGPYETILDLVAVACESAGEDLRQFRAALAVYREKDVSSELTRRLNDLYSEEAAIVDAQRRIVDDRTAPQWVTKYMGAMDREGRAAWSEIGVHLVGAPTAAEEFRRSPEYQSALESHAFAVLRGIHSVLPEDVFDEMAHNDRMDPRVRVLLESMRHRD